MAGGWGIFVDYDYHYDYEIVCLMSRGFLSEVCADFGLLSTGSPRVMSMARVVGLARDQDGSHDDKDFAHDGDDGNDGLFSGVRESPVHFGEVVGAANSREGRKIESTADVCGTVFRQVRLLMDAGAGVVGFGRETGKCGELAGAREAPEIAEFEFRSSSGRGEFRRVPSSGDTIEWR